MLCKHNTVIGVDLCWDCADEATAELQAKGTCVCGMTLNSLTTEEKVCPQCDRKQKKMDAETSQ